MGKDRGNIKVDEHRSISIHLIACSQGKEYSLFRHHRDCGQYNFCLMCIAPQGLGLANEQFASRH
jgi:hypothetical protein